MVQCEEEDGVLLPGFAGDGVKDKVMQALEKVMHSKPGGAGEGEMQAWRKFLDSRYGLLQKKTLKKKT